MWKGENEAIGGCFAAMIAIPIVAVLLFPLLVNARQGNRTATCAAHLMHWGSCLSLYAQDHGGSYPELKNIPPLGKGVRFTCEIEDTPLEYHRPPRNAPPDFVILRCREHWRGWGPFRQRVVLEYRLDGKVYKDGRPL